MSVEPTSGASGQSELRRNAIGLPGVLFQSITTMAPASAVAFTLGPAAIGYTGGALPLAVFIALIICSFIAVNIGSLARYLPSAGGYFTYVSRSLGPQAGWMTGWLFDLAYLLIVPFQLLVLGPVADDFVRRYFHFTALGANGWIFWAMVFAIVVFALTYFGIKISADTSVVLGVIEISVFVLLSIWLIVSAGSGNTLETFNPASSTEAGLGGWQGILQGMIFVFLAFAGFESSAPLAEEAHDPRRTVPRAILLATVLIGIFYVFCSYAGVVGWGFNTIGTYTQNTNPWATMAARVWGPFEFIVSLAILNSALANANAGVNAASRVLFAMGRIRVLPGTLSHVNRFRTPDFAIIFTMIVAVVATLWPGLVYGPAVAFNLLGTIIGIPIIVVYMATCLAVPFFYQREHRREFNVGWHIILPAIPFIVLAVVLYFQFVPLPAAPYNLAGPLCAAWFVLGLIIVVLLTLLAPQAMTRSSEVYLEE
ncbi:MAG TPA: APC family permease [Ktedonobacteraceae bacterium]|nr:APC family permease [Ktedonobacteraceae bacterium]